YEGERDGVLYLDFHDLPSATAALVDHARRQPVSALLAVDDGGTLLAARAGAALGLPHNEPEAADAARDKYRMRQLFAARGIPVPAFRHFTTADDPAQ